MKQHNDKVEIILEDGTRVSVKLEDVAARSDKHHFITSDLASLPFLVLFACCSLFVFPSDIVPQRTPLISLKHCVLATALVTYTLRVVLC